MIAHRREGIRAWPVISGDLRRVLDVGCGTGDALDRAGTEFLAVGIDIDHDALRSGSKLFPRCRLSCATGEALPFKDASFDAVLSRVALPYMNLPIALEEIARVLRHGGEVWLVFQRFAFVRSELMKSLRTVNAQHAIFLCYVILNGLVFHFLGRTFRFPLNPRFCESFQTERGIRRALARAGFAEIRIVETSPFIVTAQRGEDPRAASPSSGPYPGSPDRQIAGRARRRGA